MPIRGKVSGGEDFKRCPPGSHVAVCNLVADMGVQDGLFGSKRQVYIRFEVPDERIEYEREGKKLEGPQVIGITVTLSMHKKAKLRQMLEGWRGKAFTDDEAEAFDVDAILGQGCMLNVIENEKDGKTYSNIAGFGKLPRTIPAPKAENPLLYYADDNKRDFEKLPEWLRKKINEQIIPEEKEEEADGYYDRAYEGTQITDDDIPF